MMSSQRECGLLLLVLLVALQLGALESTVRHLRHLHLQDESNNVHGHLLEKEQKLLLECQNADYRTYIKCLKREKRQHRDFANKSAASCLDECFKMDCRNDTQCFRDCHAGCRSRRLIETYSKTVETKLDCENGDCDNNRQRLPNITANIHITNVLPNTTWNDPEVRLNPSSSSDKNSSTVVGGATVPKVDINNVINNQFGFGPWGGPGPGGVPPGSGFPPCICPGCNCFQSLYQPLPQITIGFGNGQQGNNMYQQWPPYQMDCSMCNNPFLRLQCETKCYQVNTNDTQSSTTTTTLRPPPINSRSSYPNQYDNRRYQQRE